MNHAKIIGMKEDTTHSTPPLTAIYAHNSTTDKDIAIKAARPILGTSFDPDSLRFLSSWGSLLEPTAAYRPCGHYLAPLNPSIKRAIVLRSTIALPASKPMAALLGTMLSQMGEGSELYLDAPKAFKKENTWVSIDQLKSFLPSCPIEDRPGGNKGWIRISWSDQLASDIQRLGSIYPLIATQLDAFAKMLDESDHPCSDPLTHFSDSVEGSFAYSMHWALHTHGTMESIFAEYEKTDSMRILDIGGSYGFLACELAADGHQVTNLELLQYRIDQVFPWLADACNVSDRVEGIAKRMEELEGADDTYDVICFMGSLLCIDRHDIPGVLRRTSKLLKPGGLIILRENMLLPENAHGAGNHEERFTAAELHEHLQTINPKVSYMDHLGHQRTYKEATKLWTLFATVQKQPECACSRNANACNTSSDTHREMSS